MQKAQDIAFFLQNIMQDLGDLEHDADLVEYPKSNEVSFVSTRPLLLPNVIYFEAAYHVIAHKDYIFNNVHWPIVSKKMLGVLTSIGDFEHRAVPIVMLDDSVKPEERFDTQGKPKSGVANEDFVILQLLEYSDVLDRDQSIFEKHWLDENLVTDVKKVVLKEPAEGLPPIFRIDSYFTRLFISRAAKEALESAGCKGYATLPIAEYTESSSSVISKE